MTPCFARAHVGSPNVFFEGKAGPFPVHVIITPPEVIPGLAEISVRVDGGQIEQVTALPMKWNAGRKGAPPPDVARLIPGETNLYNAQLWFMESGSQSIELAIKGGQGTGKVIVPVDAVAMRVLGMPKYLGVALGGLGLLLAVLLVSVIGAAVRESVLEPGTFAAPKRTWLGRLSMITAAVLLVLGAWGGKSWWDAEAADYRNNRLYQPMSAQADVSFEGGNRILRLEITDPRFARASPLMPDHGKLMHLFLIQEPKLQTFAHLHPIKRDRKTFELLLPNLPKGTYRLYADITYETGFSDTLTTRVEIPESKESQLESTPAVAADSDDTWKSAWPIGTSSGNEESDLANGYRMQRSSQERYVVNKPVHLRFTVHNVSGEKVTLEPYLGMRGHLSLTRDDGKVFTHLHPGGSPSMASIQLSVLRSAGEIPLTAAFGESDPICKLPALDKAQQDWLGGGVPNDDTVSFPYAFPKPGRYRLWVQVKIRGKVQTGIFDVQVFEQKSEDRASTN